MQSPDFGSFEEWLMAAKRIQQRKAISNFFDALAEYVTRRNIVEVLRQFSLSAYAQHQAIRREYGPHSPIEAAAWAYYKQCDNEFYAYADANGGWGSINERRQIIMGTPEYQDWLSAYRKRLDAEQANW